MNYKNELFNLKRRLIALSLAGGCLFGLAGCGDNDVTPTLENDNSLVENDEVEKKEQLLCIYEEKAVIIEPKDIIFGNSTYKAALDGACDMLLPMAQFIYFGKDSPISAEDYVTLVCGSDFPIEYIRNEDYNKSR